MNLANLEMRNGNWDAAIELAEQALEIDPQHAGAKSMLGSLFPFSKGQREIRQKKRREKQEQEQRQSDG